ncbi:MAG: molybdenum cofactor biosynthesis protein B [Massilia sp.]
MKDTRRVTLACAVLTVSNSRTAANDTAGDLLAARIEAAGHRLVRREIVADDIYQIRRAFSDCIADPGIDVVISTGGTGFSLHNSVPEGVAVLLDQEVPGFGELFRQLSYLDVGSSTIQSRALAGLANRTLVFCLPGSVGACALAWDRILLEQLDSTHKPCNFASHFRPA